MRQHRSSGSVEGVMGNHDPYSDWVEFNAYTATYISWLAGIARRPLHAKARYGMGLSSAWHTSVRRNMPQKASTGNIDIRVSNY
jgi:hypothetical protein